MIDILELKYNSDSLLGRETMKVEKTGNDGVMSDFTNILYSTGVLYSTCVPYSAGAR